MTELVQKGILPTLEQLDDAGKSVVVNQTGSNYALGAAQSGASVPEGITFVGDDNQRSITVEAEAGQTTPLLSLEDITGSKIAVGYVAMFGATPVLLFQRAGADFPHIGISDTGIVFGDGEIDLGSATDSIYLNDIGVIYTDSKLVSGAGLGADNSAAATTPGTVTKKMEVFDGDGASLGFIAIYDAIT